MFSEKRRKEEKKKRRKITKQKNISKKFGPDLWTSGPLDKCFLKKEENKI
jgi:hypothetical protein